METEMKIIVANYRYFIAGGPEKYMFKFIEAAEKRGVEIIPFRSIIHKTKRHHINDILLNHGQMSSCMQIQKER